MALTKISTDGVKDDAVTAGKIPANAVGSSELADNAVDTAAIAADAVTGAKIADDAINSEHYTDGSIDTAHIADNAVTTQKIAADAITGNQIADDAVVNEHLANNCVNTVQIADSQVTTNKIADDAVTNAKMADDAIGVAQLSASGTASSSTFLRGDNSWTTVNTDLVSDTTPQLGADLDVNDFNIKNGTSLIDITENNRIEVDIAGTEIVDINGNGVDVVGGVDITGTLKLADTIEHSGDSNTKIRFPAADNISMESGGSEIFRVTPDAAHGSSHSIQLKSAHVVDGAAVTIGGTKGDSAGIARGMLNIRDSNAYDVTDNGGAIGFSAVFNSGGSHTTMSQIEGVKANNTDGNYEGAIDFYTRHHNGNMIKKARIGLNGLSFQSDTAANNCLNDYEEGTWTPVMKDQSGNTYSGGGTITGHYVKIGEMVIVQFSGTSLGNSGMVTNQILITGLPFTPRETAIAFAQLRYGNNMSNTQFGPHVQCDANNSIGSMNKIADNAGDIKTIDWNHMQHSSGYYGIRWTLSYRSN